MIKCRRRLVSVNKTSSKPSSFHRGKANKHQQQQDLAERKYQMLRWYTNTTLSHTSAPANTWLLCLLYVCFLLNCLACQALQWRTPPEALEGSTPDISPLLHSSFWDPVNYKFDDSDFPSGSTEGCGRWVGITENVGHTMTYHTLTDDTKKVIYRSNVSSALTKEDRNKCVDLLGGEEVAPIINFSKDDDEKSKETNANFRSHRPRRPHFLDGPARKWRTILQRDLRVHCEERRTGCGPGHRVGVQAYCWSPRPTQEG